MGEERPPWAASAKTPTDRLPEMACDCHAHVFGPRPRYPLIAAPKYAPPPESWTDAYERLHARLGVARGVLVQPSVYGFDNACMLDAMNAIGERVRGVAVVPTDVDEAALERLDAAGVRGLRINSGHGNSLDALEALAARIRPFGWHIQIFVAAASELVAIEARLRALEVETVIDHMGRVPADRGVDDPAFRALIGLVGDGVSWVKISWAETLSVARAPFADVDPMVRALVAAAPDRVVWGTDWPHTSAPRPLPDDADLVDLVARWVPDDSLRRRILVDNPARLYGFDARP